MIRLKSLVTIIGFSMCLVSQQLFAQTEPVEKKVLNLVRTANSGTTLTGSLSKNLYRTETYDAPYTVEIPYEVDETYIEKIPYQVEVPYTEYVTDYRQEYVCHNVTRYREECRNETRCRTIPGTPQCHNEVKCRTIPGRQECRNVEECGTNVHGQRICKTRRVCENGSSEQRCENERVCENGRSEQRCENERVCEREPYTDQECGYKSVPYQREVSGVRTETRYREETRTRKVTKYRTEERCCKPKTRQVFDKQIAFQVAVHFPQNAILDINEIEQLKINLLSADEKTASVGLEAVNTIFGYKIAKQLATGANIDVELEVVPKFDLTNAGPDSIKTLMFQFTRDPKKFYLKVEDTIKSKHIQNSYKAIIIDEAGQVLEEQALTLDAEGNLIAQFLTVRDKKAKVKVRLQVLRSGAMVQNSQLGFEKLIERTK